MKDILSIVYDLVTEIMVEYVYTGQLNIEHRKLKFNAQNIAYSKISVDRC